MMLFDEIKLCAIMCVFSGLMFAPLGCTDKSEAEKLKRYYGLINAEEGAVDPAGKSTPPAALGPSGGTPQIVAGTPRISKDGYCGDGIINGTTEDCDQGAIQNTSCRDYGGISGEVRCQPNCLYDISDCMTPKVDRDVGGIAETCKCHCNSSACSGGCKSSAVNGQSACEFKCDNQCTCQCEGKLNSHLEECDFNCICTVDANGNPDCQCNLDECDLLVTVSHNIGTLVSTPNGIGAK